MAEIPEKGEYGVDKKVQFDQNHLGAATVPSEDSDTSGINERSLLRKLDLRLLPAVSILYLLSFLDRSNVANARLEGLTTGLNDISDLLYVH
jgi:hypothetical protein